MFNQKEKTHLIISIVIFGFIFGFNDNQAVFNLLNWVINFIRAIISASLILIVYEITHKIVAKRYMASTEYELWGIKRYGFFRSQKFPKKIFNYTINSYPLGIIISIIATLLSSGTFYITLLSTFNVKEYPYIRIGAKFRGLTHFEEAKIAASSILVLILLAAISNVIIPKVIFNQLTLMIFVFILWHLLPISSLDGSKIFFGSVPLYVAIASFSIISYFLMSSLSIFASLIISAAAAIFLVFLYIWFKKS